MNGRRGGNWSDRVLPWLFGAAILVAIVVGVRSIGSAQTGELGRAAAPPANPDLVAAPELEPERVQLHECRGAGGETVYAGAGCGAEAAVRDAEKVPVQLAPAR